MLFILSEKLFSLLKFFLKKFFYEKIGPKKSQIINFKKMLSKSTASNA